MKKEAIDEKVKERMQLEQQLIQARQQRMQLDNMINNATAQIIRLEGWFEGAGVDYQKEVENVHNDTKLD